MNQQNFRRVLALVTLALSLLAPQALAANNVVDGSFEQPVLAANGFVEPTGTSIAGSPWTFTKGVGTLGVSGKVSPWTVNTVATTDGNQVAFINGSGTLSQTVSFTKPDAPARGAATQC